MEIQGRRLAIQEGFTKKHQQYTDFRLKYTYNGFSGAQICSVPIFVCLPSYPILGSNKLGGVSVIKAVAVLLRDNDVLQELALGWNCLGGPALRPVFEPGLRANDALLHLGLARLTPPSYDRIKS